ncbi:GAF domain-containing protein [Amycolatopsis sp. K13G38]|uniref:Oxygen sensor histidine kinase NreB n=1 Tax=Amycolatopsis acididurans TaxID=2724524 RepID=A0ABX1IVT0_9PSEU|nr:ATP-binding protein [Amycolatopsis acididurans]NKQ51419.1 GAF domain-containing protein [Amycolatopsis acididurans]
MVAPLSPAVDWARLALDAPDGLALVDSAGRFVQVNQAAARLCGRTEADLAGMRSPFALAQAGGAEPAGLLDDGSTEQVTTWSPAPGLRREFAYREQRVAGEPELTMIAFRDVTDERHRQRRVAAIARTAAKLATEGSLIDTLDALAAEVVKADALAGAQILTLEEASHDLRVMGTAGFAHRTDFFDRLMQVERRGGTLRMREALRDARPVVVPNRWTSIRDDPAWQPLRDYHARPEWDSFASVPLMIRGRAAGVLNAFFTPAQAVGQRTLEFLIAMAEQAAIAIDYRALLQRERDVARREERQRLARDLHDSIVQQVFSISMQAKSMEVLGSRGELIPAEPARRIADEVGLLSRTVLTDLRAMVHELRPSSAAGQGGLEEALRALVDSTTNRTGLRFSLALGQAPARIQGELAEDVYRILAEAIHNVVKHAGAGRVNVRFSLRGKQLRATVTDDGRGIGATGPGSGYGLKTMRERAQRWGGTVTAGPRRGSGTIVRLAIPLAERS